ncbi:MAG: hypothetical protein HKM90_02355 [Desulfobacteraceae bacterium]|nr:hypothetical protein [Desulfobacteraceae bacterium]
MNYATAMNSIDTTKALNFLEIEATPNGSYLKFSCPKCQKEAVIKTYGEKKNVWFCPECRGSGHIISLAMVARKMEWEEAKKILIEKALSYPDRKIREELKLTYELEYDTKLEEEGISEENARTLEVGRPKGKNILAGHIAFTVHDEEGKKVAYFGIHTKTGRTKAHSSFNPELYLYGLHSADREETIFFTTDMFECVRQILAGNQSVCNFGLPYLSQTHLNFLTTCQTVVFSPRISNEIMIQAARNLENPLSFLKDSNNGK